MGAHEGFVEVVRTNMSLIRRRLKSPLLVMKLFVKGDKSQTDMCLCYMQDRVPKKLLEEIQASLDNISLESILSTGYIRPFLEHRSFELFSTTGTTERPDVLCSKLIEGRVALLIDGVPFAIIIPRLFCESFQTLDDYAFKPYYAVFIRWIKYVAFLISILLPSVYVAVAVYHPELLNSTLLMILVNSEANAPLSLITEAVGVLLMYEIIREAGIRLPKAVGGAVSIVSGLIIGDAAVNSGLISTPLLTISAIAVISGYVVPELNPQISVLRLAFLAAGGMLGLFGIGLLACGVLVNICASENYGFPYTAPVSPFKKKGMRDTALRVGFRKMQSGDFTVEEYYE
jgi:spore germination protein KA